MTRGRRATTGTVLILLTTALSACGTGQVSQTATQDRDRTGGFGVVGDLTLRAVQLVYPPDGVHGPGEPVRLTMAIVNRGTVDDELVGVTAGPFTGARTGGPGTAQTAGDLAVGSGSDGSDTGTVSIPVPSEQTVFVGDTGPAVELTGLAEAKSAARSVPVTLTFARAGQTTVLAVTEPAPEVRPRGPVFDFHHEAPEEAS